jgi:hypothetical protein
MCPAGWEEANLLNREVKNKALDMIYRGEFANNACGYINALFRYTDTQCSKAKQEHDRWIEIKK